MDKYHIPQHLDTPFKIVIWTADEFLVFVVPFLVVLSIFNAPLTGVAIGGGLMMILKKLKGEEGHHFLLHLTYLVSATRCPLQSDSTIVLSGDRRMKHLLQYSRLQHLIQYRNGYLILASISLILNMLLVLAIFLLIGHERIVIVPSIIEKSFWVTENQVSPDYLLQMSRDFANLRLNVTASNAGIPA